MTERLPPAARFSVHVSHESDVVVARQRVRELAREQGLHAVRAEALAIAVTEIARNIVTHACRGDVVLGTLADESRHAVVVIACDAGPGIADIGQAMADGFSTGGGLGLGLSGARRLVDEFEIESRVGAGTTVTLRQWTGVDRDAEDRRRGLHERPPP